jgi:hypothetical protein
MTTAKPKAPSGISSPAGGIKSGSNTLRPARPEFLDNELPFVVSKTRLMGYSMSEIAGHASFICVCAAYLNTDILMLRILSMGSITLSIVFQFYRAIPLWIPIRWNFLLLGINTTMTIALIVEKSRANNMPKDMEQLYEKGLFEQRGFSRVEFLRLFSKGKQYSLSKGSKIASHGSANTKL